MKWVLTLPNKKQCSIELNYDRPEKGEALWTALAKYDTEHKTGLYFYILTDDAFEPDPENKSDAPPICDEDIQLLEDRFFAYNPGVHMLDEMVTKSEEVIKLTKAVKQPVENMDGLKTDIQDLATVAGDADYIRESAMFYMWAKAKGFNGQYGLDETDYHVIRHLSTIYIECIRISDILAHLKAMSIKTGKDAAKNSKSAKWWREMNDLGAMAVTLARRVEKIKSKLEADKSAYKDLKVKI